MISQQPTPSGPAGASESSVANRYGAPKPKMGRTPRVVLAAGVLLLAVVAAAVFSIGGQKAFTSKDIAFEILSPSSATVTFDLDKKAADTVSCSVRVLNESYAVVGWKSVVVGPGGTSGREKVRETVELRTESLGVSGGVGACWVLD